MIREIHIFPFFPSEFFLMLNDVEPMKKKGVEWVGFGKKFI
jgi:hypothetical protein